MNNLKLIALLGIGMFTFGLQAQQIPIVSFEQLEPVLNKRNDTTYVVNFWATWCKPCVKEMPGLLKAHQKFHEEKFRMILVSMDFDTQLESKVLPFVKEHNIDTDVILLNDNKQHQWIDKVDKNWSGAIPITLIYNKEFYFFREGEINFDELNEMITKNLIK
jgi:thiol-disulfide isomerase/thioredoxin